MDHINVSQRDVIEVKTSGGFKAICILNILFIEAAGKCSVIYLNDQNIVITYHLLKWYDKYLIKPCFFRCHNSYIVNCLFVDCYCTKTIILKNKNKIPLSRNRIYSFKENLKHFQVELSKADLLKFFFKSDTT